MSKPTKPTPPRASTAGYGGAPKIVFMSDGHELHGHRCASAQEAEDYVRLIGPSFLRVQYDDEVALQAKYPDAGKS